MANVIVVPAERWNDLSQEEKLNWGDKEKWGADIPAHFACGECRTRLETADAALKHTCPPVVYLVDHNYGRCEAEGV